MNGPLDWAVNEMPSDFTIKIFIMAMLVTPCTVIIVCLFQRLMWIMTTETETLKKAVAPDFTRYLLFTYICTYTSILLTGSNNFNFETKNTDISQSFKPWTSLF